MVMVDRVLPWRREVNALDREIGPLVANFRGRQAKAQVALVEKAYRVAAAQHEGQLRESGEAYISHPLAVATIVAEQTQDAVTIAAALLHDVVEDCALTLEEMQRDFPVDVALIVDGVTKLDRIQFPDKAAQQAASMRKLFVAMTKDLRVLIIKLADRLHNMRTLGSKSIEKQHRTAQETLDVYAPLAHRLGMSEMRAQLEDLSFAALHPKRYAEIDQMVWSRTPERELYLTQVIEEVRHRLAQLGIHAEVTGRPKNLWSIYEKMVVKGRPFEEIFDLVGIRVLGGTVKDCYASVGSIHSSWRPVQGRFKDYIAMPKYNSYQSLHTTVVGPQGKLLEVQIRTREMNLRAEFGVAAHWRYKAEPAELEWLDRIVHWQGELGDPKEFMESLKVDLDQDEVVVFTPKGELISLPSGATPVDFAYAIHTQIGHSCIGAKVDGRLVGLNEKLLSGQTIEIFTAKTASAGPSREWLDWVASPKAVSRIRQWFGREQRDNVMESGQEELENALRVEGLPVQQVMESGAVAAAAKELNYVDVDSLYQALGKQHVLAKVVVARIRKALGVDGEADAQLGRSVRERWGAPRRARSGGVHVEGMDGVLVRLARCCTPVPPDQIVGFNTKGRGISVHRTDCAKAASATGAQAGRVVDVEWDADGGTSFVVSIEVKAYDRTLLLRDVAESLSRHHINILACQTLTGFDQVSKMRFDFEVADPAQLGSALSAIQSIDGVYEVSRIVAGSPPSAKR